MATRSPEDGLGLLASFPKADEEKAGPQLASEHSPRSSTERMASARRLLAILLVGLLVTFGLATAIAPKQWNYGPCHNGRKAVAPAPVQDGSSFSQLLNSVSQEHLHELLHRYFPKTYRHGVYPSDASAMEAVHRANAVLASSLVRMARRDNTTTTTTTASPPPPPKTTTTITNLPPTDTSLPPTGTTDVPPSPTDKPTDTSVTSTTSVTTSSPPSQTTGPPPSSKPVTSTYTSVINGTPTVVVATSYVAVSPQDSSTTTKPNGSLQTNAAAVHRRGIVLEAVVGAVVGGALLM